MTFSLRVWSSTILLISTSMVTGQFAAGVQLNIDPSTPRLQAVDVDGDGDIDLAALYGDGFFKWSENLDGAGNFAAPVEMIHSGGPSSFTVFADLDGDLDREIVWYFTNDNTVRVSWNNAGTFEPPSIIGTLTDFTVGALRVTDVDGVELPEVILTLGMDGTARLAWFPNVAGVFGPIVMLPDWFNGAAPSVLLVDDIDNEEGNDMLVMDPNGLVMAAMNTNGDGTNWTLDTLYQIFSYPFTDPQLIDVDGDGDLDIAEAGNAVVQWAENLIDTDPLYDAFNTHVLQPFTTAGVGYFGHVGCGAGASVIYVPTNPQLPVHWDSYLAATHGFTGSVELANVPRGNGLVLADVDADGRQDIIMTDPVGAKVYNSVVVPPTTVVDMPEFETYCKSGPPIELPDATPGAGTWSGPWVNNGLFYRNNVGFQSNIGVAYAVHEEQGCPVAGLANLHVVNSPQVTPALGPVICVGSGPYMMTSVPENTIWTGLEAGNILDPTTYNGDVITCAYEDPSNMVCGAIVGPFAVWSSISAELVPAGPFCVSDTVQEIFPVSPMASNNWSGDISGASPGSAFFDPAQGPGEYIVVLQRNGSIPQQCGNSDTLHISVSDVVPELMIASLPPYCASQPLALSGATPEGGSWSGAGVTNGILDPSVVGSGDHIVTYFYSAPEGCSNSIDATVELVDQIQMEWVANDLLFCSGDEPVQFTATPQGGVWSGTLDATGVLDPAQLSDGLHNILYTWTDVHGCVVESETVVAEILPDAEVSITDPGMICLNHPAFELIGSMNGTWSGSVNGMGGSISFDPALFGEGIWPVTLSVEEPGSCPGSTILDVVVDLCIGIEVIENVELISLAPNPFTDRMQLSISGTGNAFVQVFDPLGRMIMEEAQVVTGVSALVLELPEGSDGVYLVRLTMNDAVHVLRAVRAR